MAPRQHLEYLLQGVETWNKWREDNPALRPRLRSAKLRGAKLPGANLAKANLSYADLRETDLSRADLSEVDLTNTNLAKAILRETNLCSSTLLKANLYQATLQGARLRDANLTSALLVGTSLYGADLTGARVYGMAVWSVDTRQATQNNLIITADNEAIVTVDDMEVAQFIYLLLNRSKLRNIIDTITSKAVLILGRFTPERKIILDALANKVREHKLLPIIFDFERSSNRDFTETIKTLAGLSLFVIVDITNPKSAPLELEAIVPDYQIPFVPIIQKGEKPFAMFRDLTGKYDWVLGPVITYSSLDKLTEGFKKGILDRAWKKQQELAQRKAAPIEMQSIDDFVNI